LFLFHITILPYQTTLVKYPILWLTIAKTTKSAGLAETNRLGYAILDFTFNRGFFDIILPAARICLLTKYTSIIGTVKRNLQKIFGTTFAMGISCNEAERAANNCYNRRKECGE
jgi:hypothetical protein